MCWNDVVHLLAVVGFYGGAVFAWAGGRGVLIYTISVVLGAVSYVAGGWRAVVLVSAVAGAVILLS